MGSKRVIASERRIFLILLSFFVFVPLVAKNNEKAILNYTKAKYLAQSGKINEAEKLYIKAYKDSHNAEILSSLIKDELNYGRYRKANRWIKEYDKKFTVDSTILKIKAVYFYDTGKKDSLQAVYNKLYALGERNKDFLTVYLNELSDRGKYRRSLKVLEQNRDVFPAFTYYKTKAFLFNSLKDYDSSLAYFDSLKTMGDSFSNYVITGKAMVYESEGDLNRAINLYEKLPGNFYIKNKLADLYYQTGRFKKLHGDLDTLLFLDPSNSRYWRYMGRIAQRNGDIQYAFSYYFTSQGMDSTEYLSCYFLGNIYTMYKNFNRSVIWYKKALKRYPGFEDGYYKVILTYIQLAKTDSAWAYLKKALGRFKYNDTDYIYGLKGQLLYERGEYDSSKQYLMRFPNDEYDAVLLADIYAAEDSLSKTMTIYKKLIAKDSTNSELYNNLGYTIAENGRGSELDTADYYINKAIQMSPNNPYYLDSKGYVLYKRGKYDRAMDYYKTSVNLKGNAIVYYHMALVAVAKNEISKAKEYIIYALRLGKSGDAKLYRQILKLAKKLRVK